MSDAGSPTLTSLKIKNEVLADIAAFAGEMARPFAIIVISASAGRAIVILAHKLGAGEAALYIGAVLAGLGALYGAKAWEKVAQIRGDAAVKKAEAQQ